MRKLALLTFVAASAMLPAASLAQTVLPPEEHEGSPHVTLKKPGKAAKPAPPAPPAPPAGITWRNRAATPHVAPMGHAAPAPHHAPMSHAAPHSAPLSPARVHGAAPNQRHFMIRQHSGAMAGEPVEIDIRRDMIEHDGHGPARVIVRRGEIEELHGPYDEWDQVDHEGQPYDGDGAYEEEHGWAEREDYSADYPPPPSHHGYGHGYATGPCCSGGMITETITTTTTYPPTVEEKVVYKKAVSHPPRRTYKRKLRGR